MSRFLSIVFLLAFTFSMAACKKDWTCVCTDNSGTEVLRTDINDVTEDDARAACEGSVTIGGAAGITCTITEK